MTTEDQGQALTAYMQNATKGPQRAAPLIAGDNYRAYIYQGYAYQWLAQARHPIDIQLGCKCLFGFKKSTCAPSSCVAVPALGGRLRTSFGAKHWATAQARGRSQ